MDGARPSCQAKQSSHGNAKGENAPDGSFPGNRRPSSFRRALRCLVDRERQGAAADLGVIPHACEIAIIFAEFIREGVDVLRAVALSVLSISDLSLYQYPTL